jgi:hypothetical protein
VGGGGEGGFGTNLGGKGKGQGNFVKSGDYRGFLVLWEKIFGTGRRFLVLGEDHERKD